jgi:hypothetical protein
VDVKTGRSILVGAPDFEGLGEINVRGHTSLRYPKHSYHFQTKQEGVGSRKVALLGLPKESDWVLYAPYSDKSLMRDVLGYELSNDIGRYATRTRFVEVFLNESHGKLTQRNYLGIYVFEEKIKRGKNRVAIEKLTPDDSTEPNITGGYIIKKDHSDQVDNPDESIPILGGSALRKESSFRSGHGTHFYYVEPKGDEITAQQKIWLKQYINRFEQVLYGDDFKDPQTGYAAYIDPDSFIDHHLLVELSKNIDGYRLSDFFHKDRGGKLCMDPIWDWNLSFGNANGKQGWIPEYWLWPQLDDQQYSWFRRLFDDPDFGQKYVDRWGQLRTNVFAASNLVARIDQLAALLAESQARNYAKWPILGRNVYPNYYVGNSYEEEISWMKQWIEKRIAWINGQFLAPPALDFSSPARDLAMRAPQGSIHFTLDGSDPRAPGGVVAAGSRLYSSPLALAGEMKIFARARHEGRWSSPAVAFFPAAPRNSSAP